MNTEIKFLGKKVTLRMQKKSKFGIYLTDEESTFSVLLPNNQVPNNIRTGNQIEVFLYKDSEDRLIATTSEPMITLGKTASLRVTDVTGIGAFLNWGLAKDLFLPFKEQTRRVKPGEKVTVALYIDKSERLCATMHLYDYLDTDSPYKEGDKVTGTVYEITDSFGVFVAVDNKYSALIPHNEMTQEFTVGQELNARIKSVTKEGKLTLSLHEKVKEQMSIDSKLIFDRLEAAGGFLPFHDKTSPEIIKREFKISKAAFKRAIGQLKKSSKIDILENGIKKL